MSRTSDILNAVARIDASADRLLYRVRDNLGLTRPAAIQTYRGYVAQGTLHVRARVLEGANERPEPSVDDSSWTNARRMVSRYLTREVAGAVVALRVGDERRVKACDEEGFVEFSVPAGDIGERAGDDGWATVSLELVEPVHDGDQQLVFDAPVWTRPERARRAVISDIDDTVLETGATSVLKSAHAVLFTNAETRAAFPGLPALYRGLARGPRGDEVNPVFYVSSSPWNLYGFFQSFLRRHDIPRGPAFLIDYGVDRGKWVFGGHDNHKRNAIERLLDAYPDLEFILVGDSGQRDAFIYRDLARKHPGRIAAVYIRELDDSPHHDRVVEALAEVDTLGIESRLDPTLESAAEHAHSRGWVTDDALAAVREDVRPHEDQ